MQTTTALAFWDFRRGPSGWTKSPAVTVFQSTPDGLHFSAATEDPYLVSPVLRFPGQPVVLVMVRMRSTGDASGQIYYGPTFSEGESRTFAVTNDGKWHEYLILLPGLSGAGRLRLDPAQGKGEFTVAWIRVETSLHQPTEAWASPKELRGKKLIGAGQYTTNGGEKAVTARYLAHHPEFFGAYPFDGIVLPLQIEACWAEQAGLERREYFLHELLWNTVPLTEQSLAPALADLKTIRWGQLTDNFLNMSLLDGGDGRSTPNLARDADWAVIEANIARVARVCRLGGLKGFWLDTEQYGNYPRSDDKFPLGRDTPELLRKRGVQWIRAVQRELPSVKIIITFAWSPDTNEYGPLKGVNAFLDGILEGIVAPGELIHGYENTFYFGQGPGTINVVNDGRKEGYPGGRVRYALTRAQEREWRSLSNNPKKYDTFVKVGMAAWVEDDPWAVWAGYPSGVKSSLWSNAALALAYSDEYVWVWSEHTNYAFREQQIGINPFLASLRNQTFNTGREPAASFTENFATDPLTRGWYFDFDMLAIGAKQKNPDQEVLMMSTETLPYSWDAKTHVVRVKETTLSPPTHQRRRFVRPLRPLTPKSSFQAELGFRMERHSAGVICLGFFQSESALSQQSLTLQIRGKDDVRLVLTSQGKSQEARLTVPGGLVAGRPYTLLLRYNPANRQLAATLGGTTKLTVPPTLSFVFDELGAALWEGSAETRRCQYALESVRLKRG